MSSSKISYAPRHILIVISLFCKKSSTVLKQSTVTPTLCPGKKRSRFGRSPKAIASTRFFITRVISENRDIAIYLRLAPILSYSCSRSVRVHAYTRVMRIFAPLSVRRNSHGKTLIYRVGKGEGRGKEKGEGQHHGYPRTGYEIHPYIYVCIVHIFARKCTVYAWMTGNPIPSRCGRS